MDLSDEVAGYQSKTQSLRDKFKRRRKEIENLLTTTGDTFAAATDKSEDNSSPVKKPRDDNNRAATDDVDNKTESDNNDVTKPSPQHNRVAAVNDVTALLSMQSTLEREERSQHDEIFSLLSQPTARELSLLNTFKSVDGGGVKEFCQLSTKIECCKVNKRKEACSKLHFVKILQKHTDESLGDCSFLNTCFHMDTCKYIHYEVDKTDIAAKVKKVGDVRNSIQMMDGIKLVPPQWIQCDLRNFKFDVLGKFSVLMADPPWDIHMELPYGTMSDDEMRRLPVPGLQVCLNLFIIYY